MGFQNANEYKLHGLEIWLFGSRIVLEKFWKSFGKLLKGVCKRPDPLHLDLKYLDINNKWVFFTKYYIPF